MTKLKVSIIARHKIFHQFKHTVKSNHMKVQHNEMAASDRHSLLWSQLPNWNLESNHSLMLLFYSAHLLMQYFLHGMS